jgi:hypothetical protein
VQEAATALVCTILPAIEPVIHVTIKPREKYPLGQTVLRVNEQRELTKQFTRQYLEEQLLTALAGMRTALQLLGSDGTPRTAYCCCMMSTQECMCLLLKCVMKQTQQTQ